jgi:hypothetical protein
MVSGMLRLGWDLPDPGKPLLASTDTPPAKEHAAPRGKAATPSASIAVSCKASGGWRTYGGEPSGAYVALDAGVRLAARIYDNGTGEAHAVRLLGAGPTAQLLTMSTAVKPKNGVTSVHTDRTDASGFVSVRASYVRAIPGGPGPGKKYNPVDVDLAWHSLATGKMQKASLTKVSPFRVGSADLGALTAIVDGGLIFLANSGDSPLYFVRDNGKVETLPRPAGARGAFDNAVRVGDQIILAQKGNNDIALLSTTDAGKTWTTTVWSFAESADLVTIDGQPAIALRDSGSLVGVVPFTSITSDPPAVASTKRPLELLASSKLVACPAGARGLRAEIDDDGASSIVATVTGAGKQPLALKATSGYARVRADGSACTDVVVGGDEDDTKLYLSPADPTHAWLVRPNTSGDGSPRFDATPATCTLP